MGEGKKQAIYGVVLLCSLKEATRMDEKSEKCVFVHQANSCGEEIEHWKWPIFFARCRLLEPCKLIFEQNSWQICQRHAHSMIVIQFSIWISGLLLYCSLYTYDIDNQFLVQRDRESRRDNLIEEVKTSSWHTYECILIFIHSICVK